MTNPERKVAVSLPEKRKNYGVVGDTYSIVLGGDETANAYTFIDMLVPQGGGPGPHAHEFEEMFYILEGEVEIFCQGKRITATPSMAVNIPSWEAHMFKNFKSPARLLCLAVSSGLEKQFAEMGKPVASRVAQAPKLNFFEKVLLQQKLPGIVERYHGKLLPQDTFDFLLTKEELKLIQSH